MQYQACTCMAVSYISACSSLEIMLQHKLSFHKHVCIIRQSSAIMIVVSEAPDLINNMQAGW